ncbi:MAG: alpha/beta fold hydrolase [Streptosporangiales bacterium]|nr:alpha/beta fold hydrolase [Streptosporangiales bacterium]
MAGTSSARCGRSRTPPASITCGSIRRCSRSPPGRATDFAIACSSRLGKEAPVPDAGVFAELERFLDLPRVAGLTLSPDGSRLVATVSVLSGDRKKYVGSLWQVDPAGEQPARRLTSSDNGESGAVFTPDGSLLFLSDRPVPDAADAEDEHRTAVWQLPAAGGEATRVLAAPGGIADLAAARSAGTLVCATSVLPGAAGADDRELRKARRDRGVSAVLYSDFPLRHWDHDLGPAEPHLVTPGADGTDGTDLTDLTAEPGRALDNASYDVVPDGSAVVTTWAVPRGPGELRNQVRVIDVATGQVRVLLDDEHADYGSVAVSPDGQWVVAGRESWPTYTEPSDTTLCLVPLASGEERDLLPDLDRWPAAPVWAPDSSAVYATFDDVGRGRIVRVERESGAVTVLTGDDGVYSAVCPHPDGDRLFALRSAVTGPPAPVVLDARAKDQQPTPLRGPAEPPELPGRLTEVAAVADDGQPLRAWLALPHDAGADRPAPLLLWAHGGPESSWNQWSWRWNPWLLVANGYAVLLPDPALSTGYGIEFHQRGWGSWGDKPYTDLMTVTDVAVARPDVDEDRTAALGGSFGGYMANWIAGHTDRFKAIVTHASLWALDQFSGTTDVPAYWQTQFGDPAQHPERYEQHSPHEFAHRLGTPMLVIHGDKDYRVPVGEGLRLYWQLVKSGVEAQFLYFPDENHWILKPGNVIAWYDTITAFLATHVLGEPWQRPQRL